MVETEPLIKDEPIVGEVGMLVLLALQEHGAMPLKHLEHHLEATTGLKRKLKLIMWRLRERGMVDSIDAKTPLEGYRMMHVLSPFGSLLIEATKYRLERVRRHSKWTRSDRA